MDQSEEFKLNQYDQDRARVDQQLALHDADMDETMDPPDFDQYDDEKRRQEHRDFKCSFCAKTYLSYPALYTHLKNKHAKGPDGNPIA